MDEGSLERMLRWVCRSFTLDSTSKEVTVPDAHQAHTESGESEEEFSDGAQAVEAEEVVWLPPRDSNPDMLIQSQLSCR